MSENNVSERTSSQKNTTIRKLWIGTVIYLAVLVYFISRASYCSPPFTYTDIWFFRHLDAYLTCLNINDLGDALAGAFAPVAFLWLAGAVYIQSQELKAQREELNETRDVMREQLAVAKEQVKETQTSTKLFAKQTEILEEERTRRLEEKNNKIFEAKVEAFRIFLVRINKKILGIEVATSQSLSPVYLLGQASDDAVISNIITSMMSTLSRIGPDIRPNKHIKSRYQVKQNLILKIIEMAQEMIDYIPNVSEEMAIQAESYRLKFVINYLENLHIKITSPDEPYEAG